MFIQQSLEFSILFQLLCIARDLLLFAFDLKLLLLDVKRRFRLMISVHSKQMIPDTVKGDLMHDRNSSSVGITDLFSGIGWASTSAALNRSSTIDK